MRSTEGIGGGDNLTVVTGTSVQGPVISCPVGSGCYSLLRLHISLTMSEWVHMHLA